MNQKTKGPGDNVIIRLKSKEKPETLKWLNAQTNLAESIRFLIELETISNGIKNYSEIIPPERSEQFLLDYLINELSKKRENLGIKEAVEQTASAVEEQQFEEKDSVLPKNVVDATEDINDQELDIPQEEIKTVESDSEEVVTETKVKKKKVFKFDEEEMKAWN